MLRCLVQSVLSIPYTKMIKNSDSLYHTGTKEGPRRIIKTREIPLQCTVCSPPISGAGGGQCLPRQFAREVLTGRWALWVTGGAEERGTPPPRHCSTGHRNMEAALGMRAGTVHCLCR